MASPPSHHHDEGMEMFAVRAAAIARSIRAGASTSAGHRRDRNEDAHLSGPTWFAVADGMGGIRGGEVASRLAMELLRAQPSPGQTSDLNTIVATINDGVRAAARRGGHEGMGTTLVAATPVDGGVAVVHIGDSRCYRLSNGTLTQLTHDHSHVQELVDLGQLTSDAARDHRLRSVLTRALGLDLVAQPDTVFVADPVGRLMLCSDGLTTELTPPAIGRVLTGIADPQDAADRLIELALRCSARDNLTAVVLDVPEGACVA